MFIGAAIKVLSLYPDEVVRRVCDPATGLPSQSVWLPSIAEVKAACESIMAPLRQIERRDRERDRTQLALEAAKPTPESRARIRAQADQLIAETGRGSPPLPDARTAPTPELRARAVAFHERHLAELKARYAAAPLPANDDGHAGLAGATEGQGEALIDF